MTPSRDFRSEQPRRGTDNERAASAIHPTEGIPTAPRTRGSLRASTQPAPPFTRQRRGDESARRVASVSQWRADESREGAIATETPKPDALADPMNDAAGIAASPAALPKYR